MPRKPRDRLDRREAFHRFLAVERLMFRGVPLRRIADELQLGVNTIGRWATQIRDLWREEGKRDREEARGEAIRSAMALAGQAKTFDQHLRLQRFIAELRGLLAPVPVQQIVSVTLQQQVVLAERSLAQASPEALQALDAAMGLLPQVAAPSANGGGNGFHSDGLGGDDDGEDD